MDSDGATAAARLRGQVGGVVTEQRRLTRSDIECWVLKGNPTVFDLVAALGKPDEITNWRLASSYRVDLIEAEDRCLLWLSGPDRPGAYAIGQVTGRAYRPQHDGLAADELWTDPQEAIKLRSYIPIMVVPLNPYLPRTELVKEPNFAASEVIRIPQMGNPSFLGTEAYAELAARIDEHLRQAVGWA